MTKVVCNGDTGTPSVSFISITYSIVFVPTDATITVSTSGKLAVDSNAVALEQDIDDSLAVYVSMVTTDISGGVGTSSYDKILSIPKSTVLKKDGEFVINTKHVCLFQMKVDAPGLINPGTGATTTPAGTAISCSLTWNSIQTKLDAT